MISKENQNKIKTWAMANKRATVYLGSSLIAVILLMLVFLPWQPLFFFGAIIVGLIIVSKKKKNKKVKGVAE